MAEKGFLTEFCATIRNEIGNELSQGILEGFQAQDENDIDHLSIWLAGVIARMDHRLSGDIRAKIMKRMGYGCAILHNEHIKAKQKRDRFTTLEEYIEFEEKNSYPGYAVRRDGDRLLVTYNPEAMNARCYCTPFKHLKSDEKVSPTYCLCSSGHIECIWRYVTGKPVAVKVLCSSISGSSTCKFEVNLNPE